MGPPHPQPQHGPAQHNPAVLSSACDLFVLHYIFQMSQPCALANIYHPSKFVLLFALWPLLCEMCNGCFVHSMLMRFSVVHSCTSHNKPWAHFSPQAGLRCQLVSVKLPYIPCLAPCYTFYLYAHSYAFIGPLQNTVLCAWTVQTNV